MNQNPPEIPAGPFEPTAHFDVITRDQLIKTVRKASARLRAAVSGLPNQQLDTPYPNCTIRQIMHHIAMNVSSDQIQLRSLTPNDAAAVSELARNEAAQK